MAETLASNAGEIHSESRVKRARRTLGRMALHVAGGAIAAMPLAAAYGITHAEVKDHSGALPVTITAAPGHSALDLGFLGTAYNEDADYFKIGAHVKLDGPPAGLSQLANGDTSALTQAFTGIYQNPDATIEGYGSALFESVKDNAIDAELIVGFTFSLISFWRDRRNKFESRRIIGATLAGTLVASSGLATLLTVDWQHDHSLPEKTYPIKGIDASWVEGTVADNPVLATLGKQVIQKLEQIKKLEEARNQAFLETAYAGIDRLLRSDTFIPPEEDEVMVLALSDIHSNLDMIKVYQYLVDAINEKYGEDTLRLTVLAGDQTYGSSWEKKAIDEIANISEEVVGVEGNHDGTIAKENQEAAGIQLAEGETIATETGPSVLGDSDPVLTDINALIGNGEDRSRDGSNISQEEVGAQLKETAEDTNPALLITHEAFALKPIIDKDDISKATMEEWLAQPPLVHEVPAAAIMYGHWHRAMESRQLIQSDGSFAIVIELGSAGGAPSSITPSIASLPWTVPAQMASATFITFSSSENKVTKIQEFTTQTTGIPSFEPVEYIPQPIVSDNAATSDHQPASPAAQKK